MLSPSPTSPPLFLAIIDSLGLKHAGVVTWLNAYLQCEARDKQGIHTPQVVPGYTAAVGAARKLFPRMLTPAGATAAERL